MAILVAWDDYEMTTVLSIDDHEIATLPPCGSFPVRGLTVAGCVEDAVVKASSKVSIPSRSISGLETNVSREQG